MSPGWERFLPQAPVESLSPQWVAAFAGQNIVVTGAGGSIGSDLVKALLSQELRSLTLLDSSEGSLFEIQRYIQRASPATNCPAILGSAGDAALLDNLFDRLPPDVIFHAAAFKHVALLEQNLFAAVENNAIGTYTLAQAARRHGVSKLVLISTDKAVHPHSVMGVSKRVAELIVVALSGPSCRMNAIRLGNVIGSSGSVVQIFWEQMERGQPLTVTHPEASRYFLSRKEAVNAILAAGAAECNGRVLLPEFQEPIKIAELARFLTGEPTPIRFIGLRPGEKLEEDLTATHEARAGTIAGPLTVIQTQTLSTAEIDAAVRRLASRLEDRDAPALLEALASLVPEYTPSSLALESAPLVSRR